MCKNVSSLNTIYNWQALKVYEKYFKGQLVVGKNGPGRN